MGVGPTDDTWSGVPGIGDSLEQRLVGSTLADRYKIVRVLGEGGFGVVFLAEQLAPVRRQVALKVIKPGMDSHAVIARFEAERQALAMMHHSCIASVLDAGKTDRDLPFFVMELVRGTPMTEYCDKHRLTIAQRLKLFASVCDAIQHAHSKGIIHRDIKPSNILVEVGESQDPIPKVIDFGISKAMGQRLTEKTLFTEHGQLIGTPEYMSPEQAEMGGEDIDTRSDVYSLGVLLYELLTGERPFNLRRAALDEIRRVIREQEPPKPSTRLTGLGDTASRVAECRRTDLRSLTGTLRRELEWIPLKAMRKDRTDRYRTAADLGDDVRRYLSREPLLAGPEKAAYRLFKFARRHRVLLAFAGAAAVVLLTATAVSTVFFLQARAERDLANTVNDYLDDVLSAVAIEGADASLKMVDVLDAADRTATDSFKDRPESEIAVRSMLAKNFAALGDLPGTQRQLARLDELLGDRSPQAAEVFELEALRAEIRSRQGGDEEGERYLRDLIFQSQRRLGPDAPATVNLMDELAGMLKSTGIRAGDPARFDEAEAVYRDVLTRSARRDGPGSILALQARHNLALLDLERSELASESEKSELLRSALSGMSSTAQDMAAVLGPDDRVTVSSRAEIPPLHHRLGEFEAARSGYAEIIPVLDRVLGPRHWRTLDIKGNAGVLELRLGNQDLALELLTEAFDGLIDRRGPGYNGTRSTAMRLSRVQLGLGLEDAAVRTLAAVESAWDSKGTPGQDLDQEARDQFRLDARQLLLEHGLAEAADRFGTAD